MIDKVIIKDNTNATCNYIQDLPAFANGKEYNFTSGINVIIGANGCGKTTLCNIISNFMFTNNGMHTEIPQEALSFPKLWNDMKFGVDDKNTIRDGIKIQSDYRYKLFRLQDTNELMKHNDTVWEHSKNLGLLLNTRDLSTGEKIHSSLLYLFNILFKKDGNQNFKFVEEFNTFKEKTNNVWSERIENLIQYYKENTIITDEKKVTLILDEPDRNLDVTKLKELYGILSYNHPQIQLIAVVHNIALIKKLSELNYVNIIEMSENYLNEITNF